MFIFYFLFFILSFFEFDSPFVYNGHRLRGAYVEGGPFGLFVAFYFLLSLYVLGLNKKKLFLTLCLIFASQSKSAIVFLFFVGVSYFLLNYKIKPKKISTLIYGCILTVLLIAINSYWGFTSRLIDYWGDYQSVKYLVDARENDPNFVMGRISALYIVPEIIKDNTMLGVGLGNYSLVRNNPKYLGIFPSVEQWDLTGLGGIINLLVEVGILGLLFFLYPFFKMWKNTQHETVKLIIILFLLAQMCGVQLYFQYLWFAVGIMTAKNIREKNNSSRNLEINSDTENRCHYE
jgi:hypothetical protein